METYYLPRDTENLVSKTRVLLKARKDAYSISYRDRKASLTRLELEPDDLEVRPSEEARDYISFQYHPEQVARLAKALRQLKEVRNDLLKLRRRITKREHRRVVARNTVWTRGWIRKKPLQLVRQPIPEQYSWELIWGRTEFITQYQLLKRVLPLVKDSSKRAKILRKIKFLDSHPEVKRVLKKDRIWKDNPMFLKHVIFRAGSLGSRLVPVKEFKAFPIIRWASVNKEWASRMKRVRPEILKLLRKKQHLELLVASLQPSTSEYNRMISESDSFQVPGRSPSEITETGYPSRFEYYPNLGGRNVEVRADREWVYPAPHEVQWCFTKSLEELEEWTQWTNPYDLPPHGLGISETDQWDGRGCSVLLSGAYTPSIKVQKRKPQLVNLDHNIPALVQDLEDKRRLAHVSLRNLNLRRDEVEFNFFRSLGELKDTPATVMTGKLFYDFCRGAKGRQYVEAVTTGGRTHQLDLGALSPMQRDVLLRGGNSSIRGRKALHAAGWRSVKLKTVSKATPLKVLASVYLSWKFAIAPTIGDISTVMNNGREYALAMRRGLGQLIRRHSVQFWAERSLRRQFSVSNMALKGVNWRKPGSSVIDMRPKLAEEDTIEDELWFADENYAESLLDLFKFGGSPNHLCDNGSRVWEFPKTHMWLPATSMRWWGDLTEREYFKQIVEHNYELWTAYEEKFSPVVAYSQHLSGVAFAKFKAIDLERALGRVQTTIKSALGAQVSRLNIYQTVWDLLPLSFVTEWFSNLGMCAQACNNLVNMQLTGLNPNKQTWETLGMRVWASQPAERFGSLELSIEPILVYTRNYRVDRVGDVTYAPYGNHSTLLGVRLRLHYSLGTQPIVQRLFRTAMHRVVRKPAPAGFELIPKPRIRVSITPAQAGSLAAMLLSSV